MYTYLLLIYKQENLIFRYNGMIVPNLLRSVGKKNMVTSRALTGILMVESIFL